MIQCDERFERRRPTNRSVDLSSRRRRRLLACILTLARASRLQCTEESRFVAHAAAARSFCGVQVAFFARCLLNIGAPKICRVLIVFCRKIVLYFVAMRQSVNENIATNMTGNQLTTRAGFSAQARFSLFIRNLCSVSS